MYICEEDVSSGRETTVARKFGGLAVCLKISQNFYRMLLCMAKLYQLNLAILFNKLLGAKPPNLMIAIEIYNL